MDDIPQSHRAELAAIAGLLREADEIEAESASLECPVHQAERLENLDEIRSGLRECADAILDHAQGAERAECESRYRAGWGRVAPYLREDDPENLSRQYLDRLAEAIAQGVERAGGRIDEPTMKAARDAEQRLVLRLADERPLSEHEIDALLDLTEPVVDSIAAILREDTE